MSNNTTELSRNDRDMLIRLETKLDQLTMDVRELKDGTAVRIASLERRVDASDQWIHDYKLTQRLFLIAAGGAGAFIAFIINFLIKACSVSSVC